MSIEKGGPRPSEAELGQEQAEGEGSFDKLVADLEIETNPQQEKPIDPEQNRQEALELLDKEIKDKQQRLKQSGVDQYYMLSNNPEGLIENNPDHKEWGDSAASSEISMYHNVGYIQLESPWESHGEDGSRGIQGPDTFLSTYDYAQQRFEGWIEETTAEHGQPSEKQIQKQLDKLYESKEYHRYLDDESKGIMGFKAQEMPKDVFDKVVTKIEPHRISTIVGNRNSYEKNKIVLESFSATAAKEGDIKTAVGGYQRLDDLDNPQLAEAISLKVNELREDGNTEEIGILLEQLKAAQQIEQKEQS